MSSPNDLRSEIIDRTKDWEAADTGSRREFEAAEAATRAFAELDAGLSDGVMDLPDAWRHPGWVLVKTADLDQVLPRVEHQMTLTPYEQAAVKRLAAAAKEGS
jgi:hypothetical protein